MDALRPLWDAERPGLHSHAEHGNDPLNHPGAAFASRPFSCTDRPRHALPAPF